MKSAIVIYTDRLIPARFSGCTLGPVILIRPDYRGDRGLLEHERVHAGQFWRTLGLMGIGYLLFKHYRLRCEVEAYREQALWYRDDRRQLFARFLADKYNLGVTYDEALALLTS